MTTLQIRIDEKTKKQAKKIFNSLGLDMSTGIKLFLEQVNIRKGLPFLLTTENGLSLAQEQALLQAAQEAEKGINVTKAMDAEEAIEYLDALI